MAEIMEYKCPACGGAMEFDSVSQKMKCPFCDTQMSMEEFNRQQAQETSEQNPDQTEGTENPESWQAASDGSWEAGETDGMRVYVCESCGSEIIADETTGATTCPFCDNRVVMKGQFSGDLKPDCVIPFKLDKKAAKEAYLKHVTGKRFLPKVFKKENHVDEIKGIYVPFWLFDADTQAQICYEGERIRTWKRGDTEFTEHAIYQVNRAGNIRFAHIPADASKKMDDTLMESVEPYDFKDAVPFQSAYLAGYLAGRYDVNKEERIERARQRIQKAAEDTFRDTVKGYTSVRPISSNVQIQSASYLYALYPVWILNTTWKDKKYTFAMNGQTGKLVGDLPADMGAFWRAVLIRGGIMGAALYALMWIFTVL